MTTQETHTQETHTATELVEMYAQACEQLERAQAWRDELRFYVLQEMNLVGVDTLTSDAHVITRTLARVRAFDVETLRELVTPDTFASVTRVSVEPKAWDKARKTGAITDDTNEQVTSTSRTDERLTVRACDDYARVRDVAPDAVRGGVVHDFTPVSF